MAKRNPNPPWKKLEQRVAKMLMGKRIPTSGSAQFEGEESDVFHPVFEIECKFRKSFAISEWFRELSKNATKTKKTPLLVIHQKGMPRGDLAVVRLKDFIEIYGGRYIEEDISPEIVTGGRK